MKLLACYLLRQCSFVQCVSGASSKISWLQWTSISETFDLLFCWLLCLLHASQSLLLGPPGSVACLKISYCCSWALFLFVPDCFCYFVIKWSLIFYQFFRILSSFAREYFPHSPIDSVFNWRPMWVRKKASKPSDSATLKVGGSNHYSQPCYTILWIISALFSSSWLVAHNILMGNVIKEHNGSTNPSAKLPWFQVMTLHTVWVAGLGLLCLI